ncbi:hypothetical protein [Methanocella arvoryzae]|uniref:Uncharacterized protein n=1 Tax=Methanocella arvoryzae (strain DSM 22066 / NBRC 105507 / MRE50) TaxID=351160 RepID=Q0W4I6_METAR|nr:hypothetical protein [Methanocella arvoryzae]CAJ36707.1 hypothetical protein RCIX1439 [Methanocella arvoryzae MRE50]
MLRTKRSLAISAIVLLIISILAVPTATTASSVKILTGTPGDTITYTGSGPADSDIPVELSTIISVGVSDNKYSQTFYGIHIPDYQNSFTVSGNPVNTLYVSGRGSMTLGLWSPDLGGASSSFTSPISIPEGDYDVRVHGDAAPGTSTVNLNVKVTSYVRTDSSGSYTVSLSTAGLPAGLYVLRQSGVEVANIYLGITPPPQPPELSKTATINLNQGWNLFSLPVNPASTEITDLFTPEQRANIYVIWDYSGGDWKYWTTEPGYTNQFSSLNPRKGYYIYCYEPMSVTVSGEEATPLSYNELQSGWNLVGYPKTTSGSISSLYPAAELIWEYRGGNWYYWTTITGYVNQFDTFSPGYGYWVFK